MRIDPFTGEPVTNGGRFLFSHAEIGVGCFIGRLGRATVGFCVGLGG